MLPSTAPRAKTSHPDIPLMRLAAPVSRHILTGLRACETARTALDRLTTDRCRGPLGRCARFDLFGFDEDFHRYVVGCQTRVLEERGVLAPAAHEGISFCVQVDLFGYHDSIAAHRFALSHLARPDVGTTDRWGASEGYDDMAASSGRAAATPLHLCRWLTRRKLA